MKNLFKLIALFTIMGFSSCNMDSKEYAMQKTNPIWTAEIVDTFSFENHQYISFSRGNDRAIVHNPNCKCDKIDLDSNYYYHKEGTQIVSYPKHVVIISNSMKGD